MTTSLIYVIIVFIIGLFGSTVLGVRLARWIFIRPDRKYPLNSHPYRDYFITIAGAGLFTAIWVYGWMFFRVVFMSDPNN